MMDRAPVLLAALLVTCSSPDQEPPDPCTDHCANGVRDCFETGVDCGADCDACPDPCADHCTNGVLDCEEEGTDCGGPGCASCSDPCAGHCGNSSQDCGETGVDCGGECSPCADPCDGHCDNGLLDPDCGELGEDCGGPCAACPLVFDFEDALFGAPPTLSISVAALGPDTGEVTINGLETEPVAQAFDFDWGDGASTSGWFPQDHTYVDIDSNWIVTVTSHYPDGSQGTARALVRFVPPSVDPVTLPSTLLVTIVDAPVTLDTRLYTPPAGLTFFDDSFFGAVTRGQVEYVLSVAATLQHDFVNGDVFLVDDAFNQVVLRDPSFDGMYSLWFTAPVAFGAGDAGFSGAMQYSSFFHEMGHNVSLNSPAGHYFGGKIDGNANAICSEATAQIFQHATAHTLLNSDGFGLSEDLLFEIEQSALASMRLVRSSYEDFVANGSPFTSWNDPGTPGDETFETFMTIAYKFFEQAENRDTGYRAPLQRMMELLQTFDADLEAQYDRQNDTVAAETFRATLMVAAVSYAFGTDLRAEFRALDFPVDDGIYAALMARP